MRNLVPDSIRNNEDRFAYVTSQRQRLETLLQAFDREQENIRTQQTGGSRYHEGNRSSGNLSGSLSRNRSEAEFDRIERDELSSGSERPPYPTTPPPLGRRTSSGWMPWNWQKEQARDDPLAYGKAPSDVRNRSRASGFDLGDR
jgi:receptor expression-enhancing protein 1/2/3/4